MANILTIIPYRYMYPPMNGGQLRSFYLLIELAKHHNVHLITFQDEKEIEAEKNGFAFPENIKIYSTVNHPAPKTIFDHLPRSIAAPLHYRWLRRSLRGPANDLLLECHHIIKDILQNENIDIIYFEHLISMIIVTPLAQRLAANALRILDAHNVDSVLLEQQLKSIYEDDFEKFIKHKEQLMSAKWYETHLSEFVHAYFTCSQNDKNQFEQMNTNGIQGFVIPNGVDVQRNNYDDREDKFDFHEIIFCGSLEHTPNQDGIFWFFSKIFSHILKECPDTHLLIIGKGGHNDKIDLLRTSKRVKVINDVDSVVKYYHRSSIAIVPLRIGSGTRLKILEAMSLGNPVVSTSIGAEGIDCKNDENILIADNNIDFAEQVITLIKDKQKFDSIRKSARKFVEEKYDWHIIGEKMNHIIDELAVANQ